MRIIWSSFTEPLQEFPVGLANQLGEFQSQNSNSGTIGTLNAASLVQQQHDVGNRVNRQFPLPFPAQDHLLESCSFLPVRLILQRATHGHRQAFQSMFENIVGGALPKVFDGGFFAQSRRDDHEGDVFSGLLDHLQRLGPCPAAQIVVAENQVVFCVLQASLERPGGVHRVKGKGIARALQRRHHQFHIRRCIVCNEHAKGASRGAWSFYLNFRHRWRRVAKLVPGAGRTCNAESLYPVLLLPSR